MDLVLVVLPLTPLSYGLPEMLDLRAGALLGPSRRRSP